MNNITNKERIKLAEFIRIARLQIVQENLVGKKACELTDEQKTEALLGMACDYIDRLIADCPNCIKKEMRRK